MENVAPEEAQPTESQDTGLPTQTEMDAAYAQIADSLNGGSETPAPEAPPADAVPAEEPSPQSETGPEPEKTPEDDWSQFVLQIDHDGNIIDLPENIKMVPRQAYDRVKERRDEHKQELENWAPILDEAKQFGTNGAEAKAAVQAQIQNLRQASRTPDAYSSQYGDPYAEQAQEQMPNQMPQTPTDSPYLGEVRQELAEMRQLLSRQQAEAQKSQIAASVNAALQRMNLQGDPLAKVFLKHQMAAGDTRGVETILRDYVGQRNLTMQAAVASKQEAAGLTPDVRGGSIAPGTALEPKGMEDLTSRERTDMLNKAVADYVTSDD